MYKYLIIIKNNMGKLWSYNNSTEQTENPTSVYLDNIKWRLGIWNKEIKENEFHVLDKFIILSVWFTIKGKVWDDQIKQYTNTYFSNEIRQFNETVYAIDMVFQNKKAIKTLVAKGNWKTDVKPHMPQAVGIKAMITILDLDDGIVKCFPVAATQYFWEGWLAEVIKWFDPSDILKYRITKMYTNWTKDNAGNEILITEATLDEMKWSQAAKYKNRYISKLEKVSDGDKDSIEAAEDLVDKIDEYYKSKKEYYAKTYGVVNNAPEWEYAQLTDKVQSDEDFKKEVQSEQKEEKKFDAKGKTQEHNTTEEISIEEIPF